jgi:predicted aspartyl protease
LPRTFTIGAVFAAVLLPLSAPASAPVAGALDTPPPNLVPVTVKLSTVLAANAAATGELHVTPNDTSVEDWTFTEAGKPGTEHLERQGSDYFAVVRQDPFVDEYGQFSGVRWHKDDNGFTSLTSEADETPFLPLRVLDDLADPKNDLSLAGATTGDDPQYVVKSVEPQHRHPKWIFVDEKTGLIARIEEIAGKRRIIHTFDDYRLDRGVREPWHIHDTDGRSSLDLDWQRVSTTHPPRIDPAQFAPPKNTPTVSFGLAHAAGLPARMFYGAFVVRLSVQGRGLDFLVDTGASRSIIDHTVAEQLHLPAFGQTTALPDGKPVQYRTMIDDATVGPIRLEHFALDALDYNYQFTPDTRVVGVLGYDFLAGLVVHISYENHGSLEAIPQTAFNGPNPVPGSFIIPFNVDDGVPLVSVGIGDTVASRMIVDTAFPFTMMFSSFVMDNESEFPDERGKEHHTANVPFADDGAYGVEADAWNSPVSHFRIGPTDLRKFVVVASNLEGPAADGMLCADYLQYYDLYFDYTNERLILKPNHLFDATFRKVPMH